MTPATPETPPPPPARFATSGATAIAPRSARRHTMVLLCALCTCLNYADRVNMSVAIIPLAESLRLSLHQQSAVLSSFFVGYVPMQIGGALLCRRFGGKRTLFVGAALWSSFTALTPLAASAGLPVLLACRALMGLAEGVAFPSIFHFLSGWVPQSERASSTSLFLTGVNVGTIIALLVSPLVIDRLSWHFVFYIFGSAGLLWLVAWQLFAADSVAEDGAVAPYDATDEALSRAGVQDGEDGDYEDGDCETGQASTARPWRRTSSIRPAGNRRSDGTLTDVEPLLQNEGPHTALPGVPAECPRGTGAIPKRFQAPPSGLSVELRLIKTILTDSRSLSVCVTQALFGLVHYTLLAWLPTYFKEVYQVDMLSLSITATPYVAMALSTNIAGWLSDRLAQDGSQITRARKIVTAVACTGGAAMLFLFTKAASITSAIVFISLAFSFLAGNYGGVFPAFMDLSTPATTGLFKGVANTMTSMAGFIAAPLSAAILQLLDDDWRNTFAVMSLWFLPMVLVFCFGFSTKGGLIGVEDGTTSCSTTEAQNG